MLRFCALTTSSSWNSQDQRAQNNEQEQRCMEMRSADVLIEVRRTYAPSFMLGRIMALPLCLKSAYFAT